MAKEELEKGIKAWKNRYILKLEKENSELKAENRDLLAIAYMQGAEKQKKKNEAQLNKAKEIIKQYVLCYGQKELPSKLQIEAEQFLREVEK